MFSNFKNLLNQYCHLPFTDDDCKHHWINILQHQKDLEKMLGRHVGFLVALTDYTTNIINRFPNLLLVDRDSYMKTKTWAMHDSLTGLFNRAFLRDYLEKELDKANRYMISFSLLYLDIDHFKRLNDAYGHKAGDDVLQKVGKLLMSCSRASDLVARYGGEEFVVIMSQTTGRMAFEVADRLREDISQEDILIEGQELPIHITVSGGLASCPMDSTNLDDLFQKADKALYDAKSLGRNRIRLYSSIQRKPKPLSQTV
jgi:diguanylate cyclase (GGDEF)-like protein